VEGSKLPMHQLFNHITGAVSRHFSLPQNLSSFSYPSLLFSSPSQFVFYFSVDRPQTYRQQLLACLSTAMAGKTAPKMEYTRLGNSGLKISKVIFGCMSLGTSEWQEWVINEDAALPLLKHAYDVGLNTWDTADVYSNGKSEEIIGKALKQYNIPRNKVVILSKCYFGVSDDGSQPPIAGASTNDGLMVNQVGLSRKHILDAVDKSVARLGTYIDVLQIHRLDRDTPREEIMRALNDVVESGKVRYIGASSVSIFKEWVMGRKLIRRRWLLGNSKICRTSPKSTAGTNLSQCRTTTTCYIVKKVGRYPHCSKFGLTL
jgi:hypothetical protein